MSRWLTCLYICFCGGLASARRLRSHAPITPQQSIQMGLTESNQAYASAALRNDGTDVKLQSNVGAAMTSDHEGLSNEGVMQVVQKANSMERGLEDHDEKCTRAWQLPCPDGWAMATNGMCEAPIAYMDFGSCAPQVTQYLGSAEKMQFAEDCNAPWPCHDSCDFGHNYTGCPEGWTKTGNGYCESSEPSVIPGCSATFRFGEMSIAQIQDVSSTCSIQWPCVSTCNQNYDSTCPEGWIQSGTICTAPPDYDGDCKFAISLSDLSLEQKHALASSCKFKFPCNGEQGKAKNVVTNTMMMSDGPIVGNTGAVAAVAARGYSERFKYPVPASISKRFDLPSGPLIKIPGI